MTPAVYVEGYDFFSLFTAHMGVREDNAGWRYRVAIPDKVAGPFKSYEELVLNAVVMGYEIKGRLSSKHYDDVFDCYRDETNNSHPLEDLLGEKRTVIWK